MSTSESEHETDDFDDAIDSFKKGEPVLAYDHADRESEVDIIYPAGSIQPEEIARMRNDAGGLVCVAVSHAVAEILELPFLREELDHPAAAGREELEYDERSASSLTVNHRDTFTGITDEDRALTIRELESVASDPDLTTFSTEFRTPGHVHLLRAAPELLADRRGHTEFAITLAKASDRPPIAVVCEMLDDESGGALSPTAARAYAEEEGFTYVDMGEIAETNS